MPLNVEPCLARRYLIDLNPNEVHFYPSMVRLDRCNGSCHTLDDPFGNICVPYKIADVNLFNMIAKINEKKNIDKTYFM